MKKIFLSSFIFILLLTACGSGNQTQELTSSGTISMPEVQIASEINGRVVSVLVENGDTVERGDTLFILDDSLLQAQLEQAQSGLATAQAAEQVATAALANAQAQYAVILAAAEAGQPAITIQRWRNIPLAAINETNWYFTQEEQLNAATAVADSAREARDSASSALMTLLAGETFQNVAAAETRLAQAQSAYIIAHQLLDQTNLAVGASSNLRQSAQDALDAALNELNDAQAALDELLTPEMANDLQQARAELAAAQARYDDAAVFESQLQTGEMSLSVQAAHTAVDLAQATLEEASAEVGSAEAALHVLELQLERCTITAPQNGTIVTRNLEPGEVVIAGNPVLTLSPMETAYLTTYIPENQYGLVQLGQTVSVSVDSFPDVTFTGRVTHIADQAEFTPRNVQTIEGRSGTVFAIDIEIPNPDQRLRSGMAANVTFISE